MNLFQGTASGLRQVSSEYRGVQCSLNLVLKDVRFIVMGWGLLIINQRIKYFLFYFIPRNLPQQLLKAARK